MGITLDASERATLVGTHGEGILATTTPTGAPVPLPVWYVVVDDVPYVRTPRTAKRVRHIEANPRVSLLVHAGRAWSELRGVLIGGRAEIVADPELAERIKQILDERFAGLLPPPLPDKVAGAYAETVILRISPDREPVSWDNRKVRL
ncbi:pyridoxamine 5'-phosphate oxidase [Mumia zhuanghuii]|uniref:Pyridoxamine 5'-phosphate oxidase family protein n=2 Tax=Mumia TaxID=1546255 RepID=A0ABW1QJH8_9ACTN|nr:MULTISPECIES: pyridoxamine 5'-phosphate oxidase family protein [Mumia]KAA1423050.1 pyridoxamine 5'-phosphate oxidase [Mumia zhuanghuii]